MRIVVLAHGHPELRAGGAERAAYSVFKALKKAQGVDPVFVATGDPASIGHDGAFGAFRGRSDEYLWAPPPIEWFKLSSLHYDLLHQQCAQLIETLAPDVLHVHHYAHTGVELFPIVRALSPATRLVLTLHEFMLICNNHGQMVRTGSNELCHAAAPAECAACFPEHTSGKFFLRERFIKRCLDAVDRFVSPSRFLRDRFVDWGLHAERISVIENPLPDALAGHDGADNVRRNGRLRLGLFGQLTPFKGAAVLVQALSKLPAQCQQRIELVIFGGNLTDWPEVRTQIDELVRASPVKVSLFGRYRNEDVIELMRGVDWVVVPSTWWENSPLVIQEAHVAGTPVLASNIGGMREKVIDGVTGRHFLVGSDLDLAQRLEMILSEPHRKWPRLDVEQHNAAVTEQHLGVYRQS